MTYGLMADNMGLTQTENFMVKDIIGSNPAKTCEVIQSCEVLIYREDTCAELRDICRLG